MKAKIAGIVALITVALPSYGDVFTGDGQITGVRQSSATTLQINHNAVVPNGCSTKNFAVALSTEHVNFKNLYAAILTARALGATTQFAVYDNQCIDGFPEVNIFTLK